MVSMLSRTGFCALLAGVLVAQQTTELPAGVRKVTSVEGITEYRLDNGLTVLVFPDPSKQTVTVNMTYLVGSRHENYGETGMAHLLEHLLFRGTPKHPKLQEEFRKYGARVNGTTWFDRTNYFETVPASDENLRWAIDLEADRMLNSFVSKEDLDQEMTVVRNEFEMGENSPFRVLSQRTMAAAFLWHNYGKATIGAKSDLENVSIDRLKAFYQKYYQPDNAVLTIAGKLDEARTIGMVAEIFGRIPRPTRQLDKTYTVDPVQDGERTITVRRVGDIQAIMAMYKIPDGAHPDAPALDVLSQILSSAPSGRLHKALVESRKAASVNAGTYLLREPGVMSISATVRKEGDLNDVRETMLRVVHDVAKEPPTGEEVNRAKNRELSNLELTLTDSDRVGLLLSEPASSGDWRLIFRYREGLKSVTPEDVLRVARTYLKEDNRTVGMFIPVEKPDRADIPPPTDVAAVLKDFKLDTTVAAGETFESTPENIESRLDRHTLPSGMKLALLPKTTRGGLVQAVVNLHYGDLESTSNRKRAGSVALSMLMRGTKKHTRQEIRDELDKLRARVSPSGGLNTAGFNIQTQRANLPAVLELVAEMLREPAFLPSEYEELKQSMLAGIEQRRSEPGTLAATALYQHLDPYKPGDPRRMMSPDEEVEALRATTLDDVKKFHQEFYGASVAELVVVGDHDAAEIKALAQKLFGDWKSPSQFKRVDYDFRKVPTLNKNIETPDKANANFYAGLAVQMNDDHPDYPALMMANYILGGGMSGRLFQRIRTKEGLSYGVGCGLSVRATDQSGKFIGYAIAAPQNMAKVEAIFKEELQKALKDGFTEEEFSEAKKGMLQSRMVSRSQDPYLAGLLAQLTFDGRTMERTAKYERDLAALTLEQVNAAFRKHIDPEQISYVKAGDFTKAAAGPTGPPAAAQ